MNFEDAVRAYSAGDTIFSEGDDGQVLYVVLSGRVQINKRVNGVIQPLHTLSAPEIFGELALIEPVPRAASATALDQDTKVLSVDRSRFLYLIGQQPGFALIVMETLGRWVRPVAKPELALPVRAHTAPQPAGPEAWSVVTVADGIFQFRSRVRSANVYLFKGSRQTVLVDAGLGSNFEGLAYHLAAAGAPASTIDHIVLTHEHMDHIAAVPRFGHQPRVSAHGLAAAKIENHDTFAMMQDAFDEVLTPFAVHHHLAEGAMIDTGSHRLHVLHTPGHSSGSISLYEPDQKVLITGDAVMAGGAMGGIFGSGNMSDSIYSLEKLGRLDAAQLLPGHGSLSKDPPGDLAKALARLRQLLSDTRKIFETLGTRDAVKSLVHSVRDLNR
jgi:hydroxyacylglutathione hydrolase